MGKVILGMTTSLDGFIKGRSGSVAALYPDLAELRNTEPLQEAIQFDRRKQPLATKMFISSRTNHGPGTPPR